MIDLKVITSVVRRSSVSDGEIMHPYRDWRIALVFSMLLALVCAGWGGYLFWKIKIGELSADVPEEQTLQPSINRTLLSETLEAYEKRRQLFDALGRGEGIPENPLR